MAERYDTIEVAARRSRCLACNGSIVKGELRLRLGLVSGFTYVHLACAASSATWATWLLGALDDTALKVPGAKALRVRAAEVAEAAEAAKLARLAAAEAAARLPAAVRLDATRAGACLGCGKLVAGGSLGVLEGRGVLHLDCAAAWAERNAGSLERWVRAVLENSAGLDDDDEAAVARAMQG